MRTMAMYMSILLILETLLWVTVFAEECEYPLGFSTGTFVPTEPVSDLDNRLLNFPLNLEYLEAEYFLAAAYGKGLDEFAPDFTGRGPTPIGLQIARLDPLTLEIIMQLGLQEIGHIRIIRETIGESIPRPQLDVSVKTWAKLMDMAFGGKLIPPFNPYEDPVKFMLSVYVLPYVGLTGYVGLLPHLTTPTATRLTAGLLGVEGQQDAAVRMWLYERRGLIVQPYGFTVGFATGRISNLRNCLGKTGVVDEGVVVPPQLGAEGRVSGNIVSADNNSLSYSRTPSEILRVVYATGNESMPGCFYPRGANGDVARSYLLPAPPTTV